MNSLEQHLFDRWINGEQNNETYKGFIANERERLDAEHGVIINPDALAGWHLAICALYKEGVYRFEATRRFPDRAEKKTGYCNQDVIRVAIELGLCTRPNGFMFP